MVGYPPPTSDLGGPLPHRHQIWEAPILLVTSCDDHRRPVQTCLFGDPSQEQHLVVATETEVCTVSMLAVCIPIGMLSCYHLQTKLREGNVFTPVCQSFCSHGEGVSV